MRTWLIATTVLYSIGLLPSLGLTAIAPMLFDAPGSEHSQALWVVFNCALMLPVLIVVSLAGMWIWHKRKALKIALAFSLLPIADVFILAASYLVAALTALTT